VSTQISPDGMYYWDGSQWLSTLSADGRHRWNGAAWMPVSQQAFMPVYAPQPLPARVPTSWTRPLQYAVAALYTLSGLFSLTLPFWMGGMMTQAMNQSIQNQQQLNPNASPIPTDVVSTMTSIGNGVVWVAAIFSLAICLITIVGALKRWTWIFYVVLVFLGLGVISIPLDLVNAFTGSRFSGVSGYSMPSWYYWVGLAEAIPVTAVFLWMLIALIKRGPWAMVRPPLS